MNTKIIDHFRQLWGVEKLDGVFPKMNEVYLYVGETRSFVLRLGSTLRLPDAALARQGSLSIPALARQCESAVTDLILARRADAGAGES
jgi:hypothetical protein